MVFPSHDQLVHLITALARAFGAFDAQHVELAFNVAEDEVGARHWTLTAKIFSAVIVRID